MNSIHRWDEMEFGMDLILEFRVWNGDGVSGDGGIWHLGGRTSLYEINRTIVPVFIYDTKFDVYSCIAYSTRVNVDSKA